MNGMRLLEMMMCMLLLLAGAVAAAGKFSAQCLWFLVAQDSDTGRLRVQTGICHRLHHLRSSSSGSRAF